jgi:hypothetical protein
VKEGSPTKKLSSELDAERVPHPWQRRILVRWEYHAANFLGFVQVACLVILFKSF